MKFLQQNLYKIKKFLNDSLYQTYYIPVLHFLRNAQLLQSIDSFHIQGYFNKRRMKSVENVFDLIHTHHKLDQNSFYGRQDWLIPALPPDTLSVSETRKYFDCLRKSNELLFNCLLKLGNIYKCVSSGGWQENNGKNDDKMTNI